MIYVLEDDDGIRKLVVYALQSQGFEAEGFEAPGPFRRAVAEKLPELALLDIMLPGEDGISVLKWLRGTPRTANLPVIMLTAKSGEIDRVQGLDAGADDYVMKPFGILELTARIRAVLRRGGQPREAKEYTAGTVYVCPEKHIVRENGADVQLTFKEFTLLCLLLENRGTVLTRDVLMERVWGMEGERENRTLDVHVRTLRAKLGGGGRCIETVRGIGYVIR